MIDVELDLEALMRTFVCEAQENLDQMEDALLALESRPRDAELIHTLFRKAHSVKGDAGCVGLRNVTELAHALEDRLDGVRHGSLQVTSPLITTLLDAVDMLRAMIASQREELTAEERSMLRTLRSAATSSTLPTTQGEGRLPVIAPGTLRIDTARLDRMLDLTGELAIARGRLRQLLEPQGGAVLESFLESEGIFLDLQELVMRARMVPVGPHFRQQARVVRDLAAAHGKQAVLVVEGADAEIDNTLLEQMRQPLTHMLRNALHHGIETPEERIAAGKDPVGRITLHAWQEAGTIAIEVADDGRGVDRDALLARAIAAGAVAEGQRLDDRELLDLVFRPGMSTAGEVTQDAGRGVGLDVVRRNVEQLHGTVQIASRRGEGTTITARLPLTLAIIDGFGVSVGDERYIVPQELIVECLDLDGDARTREGCGVMNVRGRALPYVELGALVGRHATRGARGNVVVVECNGKRAGILVDALHGHLQVVIKPLAKLFGSVRMVAGSAILGDGRVALILDIPSLIAQADRSERCVRNS